MKFKHIIYTAAIFGFTMFSCEDYIEEENLSNVDGGSFYTTEAGFETLVNANYAQLKEIYGNDPWLFSAGTDLYAEGRDQEPPGLSQYIQLTPSLDSQCFLAKIISKKKIYPMSMAEVFTPQRQDLRPLSMQTMPNSKKFMGMILGFLALGQTFMPKDGIRSHQDSVNTFN